MVKGPAVVGDVTQVQDWKAVWLCDNREEEGEGPGHAGIMIVPSKIIVNSV